MKKLIFIPILFAFIAITLPSAAETSHNIMKAGQGYLVAKTKKRKRSRKKSRKSSKANEFSQALKLAKTGQYRAASTKLFRLSQSPRYKSRRMQIKYLLGLTLYQMKLYQTSAFQFISVIRNGKSKYLNQSLEKLSLAADALGDDTLLNYAISRVNAESFPRVHRDMLFFRIGEFQLRNKQYTSAANSFAKVQDESPLYSKAKYQQGLAYSLMKRNKRALISFEELIDARAGQGISDLSKAAALMGKARVHYQMKDWDNAIETYRQVPRDTVLWHDTLFESSWAMLRSGRFRSAVSNFQSLHSPFYEDNYLPESLLLRSIVYLYICQYDEMEKVLNLYNKIYKPVFRDVSRYVKTVKNSNIYFRDIVKVLKDVKLSGGQIEDKKYAIPFIAARYITQEGDFKRSYDYIKRLLDERHRIRKLPSSWQKSGLGRYAQKTINRRLGKARKRAGREIRAHLLDIREDLVDFFEQEGFIRFEMISGKKEAQKKKLAGKELPKTQVGEDKTRDYYVQNGWQYYKFRGEYWLDELGNYYYVGTQSCAQ